MHGRYGELYWTFSNGLMTPINTRYWLAPKGSSVTA